MSVPHVADPPNALPRGTRLGEFEIRRVLGMGGFGIVYLAFDRTLERDVAIKEYMPASLAGRSAALKVSLLSPQKAEPFMLGLRSFVNEARLLARFDHPSLVKVHRYWEDNDTAYMAMPYYTGRNLQAERRRMKRPPHEAWLRSILQPLLGAIERLHREGVYHRDISPDNVILEPDGRPVLLDFGAARRVLADQSMTLTAIIKPAFAPIEQYAETGSIRQGPWTDLYALGATMHYLVLGNAPLPATVRALQDDQLPLAHQALPGCTTDFLKCLDWMLCSRPADRPQSVAALREALDRCPPAPAMSDEEAAWRAAEAAAEPVTVHSMAALVGPAAGGRQAAGSGPAATASTLPPGDSQPAITHDGELPTLASASTHFRAAQRPPTAARRWPLAAGAAGVAVLALWLGLKPNAKAPQAQPSLEAAAWPDAAASAAVTITAAEPLAAASTAAPRLAGATATAPGIAEAAAAAPTPAARPAAANRPRMDAETTAAGDSTGEAPAASAAGPAPPADPIPVASRTPAATPNAPAPNAAAAGKPRRAPPEKIAPPPLSSAEALLLKPVDDAALRPLPHSAASAPTSGQPGMATSITRLPPAAEPAAAAPPAASAAQVDR